MKGGVIIIGSLFWDNTTDRVNWWQRLDFHNKIRVKLPIMYGRSSSENRKNTYSMVFSKEMEFENKMGFGYVVPFKNKIFNKNDFEIEVKGLAKAEGFRGNRIAANWGATCIKINNKASLQNIKFLASQWMSLRDDCINNKSQNQTIPDIKDFGENEKSITEEWKLNVVDDIFEELDDYDFLLATSNSLRHRLNDEKKYPNVNEIAKAIYEGDYYEYFLKNRFHKIHTHHDKIISKILKFKYKISLKGKRKNWP